MFQAHEVTLAHLHHLSSIEDAAIVAALDNMEQQM
jgi:hypothetical protein